MQTREIRETLTNTAQALRDNPQKARNKNSPATAALRGGLVFDVTGPHGEKLATDMPRPMGGEASAPVPGWMMRAALASCTGTVIAMRAASLGVTLDRLEVTVESESDNRGILGIDDTVSAGLSGLRTVVRISAAKADPEQLREIARWGDAHSPVACTLRDRPDSGLEVIVD